MELNREVGIFKNVASQNEDDGFAGLHKSAATQFLKSSQRDGGGGLATDAIGANFGFCGGNLDLCNLFDLAAGRLQYPQRFLPRCRISNPYGGRQRVGNHRFEFLPAEFAHAAKKRIRALRLNDGKLWQARNQFKLMHFEQRLADRRTIAEIASGHNDVIGRFPCQLFEQFDRGGFLALDAIRIHRIQQIHWLLADEVIEDAYASIEVGAELTGESSIVERLRELAPGDLSFRNQHQTVHDAA